MTELATGIVAALVVSLLFAGATLFWRGSPSKQPSAPRYGEAMMRGIRRHRHQDELDNLADLDHGLTDIVKGVDRMPFRDRLIKYTLLETDAENLVDANHEEFYLNPELLPDSEAASARLTDLATKLLERVKEQRRRVREQIATGG